MEDITEKAVSILFKKSKGNLDKQLCDAPIWALMIISLLSDILDKLEYMESDLLQLVPVDDEEGSCDHV